MFTFTQDGKSADYCRKLRSWRLINSDKDVTYLYFSSDEQNDKGNIAII